MRIASVVGLIAAVALVGRVGAQATASTAEKVPVEMQVKRDRLGKELLVLDGDTEKKLAALRQQYDTELVKLKQLFQADGDLDAMLEVDAERKRVADKLTIAVLESYSVGDLLKPARELFLTRARDLQQAQDAKQTDLVLAYVARLKQLQRDLTKANRIDDALVVRSEIATYQNIVGDAASSSAPTPEPPVKQPPTAQAPAVAEGGVVLNPLWRSSSGMARRECEEFPAVLEALCKAKSDLSPHPAIKLYDDITYLMPSSQVGARLNRRMGIRRAVVCDAFPKDSFFTMTLDGFTGEGFSKFLLVTDYANQVVGVALINESSTEPTTTTSSFNGGAAEQFVRQAMSRDWTIYDFVQGGTKGSRQSCVTHNARANGDTVDITTQLLGWRASGGDYHYRTQGSIPCSGSAYGWSPQAKETVRLILAKPLAEFLLFSARR